jgi:hypothetical protein
MYNNTTWLTMQSRVFFIVWLNFASWQQIKKGLKFPKEFFWEKSPRVAIFGRKKIVDIPIFRTMGSFMPPV